MLKKVSETVSTGKKLLVHAPTGLGKTIASIGPALKHALDNGKTVFFLTPKHTQHRIVIDTLKKIKQEYSSKLVGVDVIGKKWMCPLPASNELKNNDFSEFCRDLKKEGGCTNYNKMYDEKGVLKKRAEEFIQEIMDDGPFHVEEMCGLCAEKGYCPYEASLELAKHANAIVGDYYHLFHPSVRSAFLSRSEKVLGKSIIIVDESHNLPGRVRNLMSSRMTSNSLGAAMREADKEDKTEIFNQLIPIMEELRKKKGEMGEEEYVDKNWLTSLFEKSSGEPFEQLVGELLFAGEEIRKRKKKSFIGGLGRFLEEWLKEEEGFVRILRKKDDYFEINKTCLDPSVSSGEVFKASYSSVLMSATLNPTKMYADLLGVAGAELAEYPSPFPSNNRLVLVIPETTTRYAQRSQEQYERIAEKCESFINLVDKNTAIFYPSYNLLKDISDGIKTKRRTFHERRGMSKQERDGMLKEFIRQGLLGNVLHGTMGGSFAEGIDLPGKALECVVLVGIPFERPDLETKALINYYENKFGNGWGYGYIFPAMNRLIQAAGRAIRSDEDKAALIFMDERFIQTNYFSCFPRDWNIEVTRNPEKYLKTFFHKK